MANTKKKTLPKELVMRELRGNDLFSLLSIFSKLDIVDEVVDIFNGTDVSELNAELIEARGRKIMSSLLNKLLTNISSVRNEVNALLADLTDSDVKEIEALNLGEYIKLIKDFVNNPDFKDFLSSIA